MEETGESNCRGMNECRHRNERNYCNRAALSGTCETYGNASFKPGDFDLRSFNSVSATLKTEDQMQQFQKKMRFLLLGHQRERGSDPFILYGLI